MNFNQSPLLVFYELTLACDLVCLHCRACAQKQRDPRELDTKRSQQLIEQLTQFPEPPLLILTGGDPFKRHDLFDIIQYAVERGLSVSITPSATPLVTTQALERLANLRVSRLAISIDGARAETHDAHRGVAGSFEHSLRILREAKSRGLSTQINTTIRPENLAELSAMADLGESLGIDLWSVFFLVPVGRAEFAVRLSADEYEQAFEALYRETHHRSYQIKTTEAPHYRRYLLQQYTKEKREANASRPPLPFARSGINDGKGVMFVGHDGTILPSGFLPVTCGAFPQDNIVDVYQNSPIFRSLRDPDQLQGKCGQCQFRQVCGGSRARAYATRNDYLAAEPDCCYQPLEEEAPCPSHQV